MDTFVSLSEAQEMLGISRWRLWLLVRDGALPTYRDPLDGRKALVRQADLDAIRANLVPTIRAGEPRCSAVKLAARPASLAARRSGPEEVT